MSLHFFSSQTKRTATAKAKAQLSTSQKERERQTGQSFGCGGGGGQSVSLTECFCTARTSFFSFFLSFLFREFNCPVSVCVFFRSALVCSSSCLSFYFYFQVEVCMCVQVLFFALFCSLCLRLFVSFKLLALHQAASFSSQFFLLTSDKKIVVFCW